MTDEEKAAEEIIKEKYCNNCEERETFPNIYNCSNKEHCDDYYLLKEGILLGLAEGRKEKELSYRVGKVTKAELNKCKTIEEKMEWLGKVLGYAIFKDNMNYAVWVNVQKNNIIESIEKENEGLKKEISVLLSCANCQENKGGYVCEKEYNDKCLAQKIEYIKELKEENAELKAQIEKMKSCNNCKHRMFDYPFCTEKTVVYSRNPYKKIGIKSFCENMNKWELAK